MSGFRWLRTSNLYVVLDPLIRESTGLVRGARRWQLGAAHRVQHGALHVDGTRLPVQSQRIQGRPVDGVVVDRHPLHPARGQVHKPAASVEARTAQPQVQPLALGTQDHGHRSLFAADKQPSFVHSGQVGRSADAGGRLRRAAGARRCRGTPCTASAAPAAVPGRPGGGDRCRCTARRRPRSAGAGRRGLGQGPLAFGVGRG